jgi:competence protein ComEC
LKATTPDIAIISVGKNSYGHPHQEILDMLKSSNIKTLRTDEVGNIEVITDGKSWFVK